MNSRVRILGALPILFVLLSTASRTQAGPAIGFIERWNSPPSISTWSSQADDTNPGTGGADGGGDGYLHILRIALAPLGAFSNGPEYTGDWIAANVNQIKLALNDVEANQALEIHVSVGNDGNLWQYNTGFSPPENAWATFTVDLTDSTRFTHIIAIDGKGFLFALQHGDHVLVRHDNPPFSKTPNDLIGEFGLDNLELTSSLLDAGPPGSAAGRPVELAAPYPNPARGAVACAFETFDEGSIRVTVMDVAGRIVRSETLAAAAPGRRTWVWDGRDDRGQVAPAGAYRVRVVGQNGGTSRPFIRVD